MRRLMSLFVGAAVAVGLTAALPVLQSQQAFAAEHGDMKASKDIVETAASAGQFNTLAAAIKAAGLAEALKGKGPFTVFAPTDEAFAKLPPGTLDDLLKPENKEKLASILKYHVVSGKATSSDVAGMSTAKTLEGKELKLSAEGGKVQVNGANVTKADIMASNGVIHVIDRVLLP